MTERAIKNEDHWLAARDGVEGPLKIQKQAGQGSLRNCLSYPSTVGRIIWTGKPKSSMKDTDKVRLNAIDGPNTNRKRRPWIIIEELPDGWVRVMSSTTQREKGWEAIAKENQRFFLPISPTDSNDRPVLNVKVDFDGRFVGKSLLYLCIEVDIQASELQGERCMGYLDPSAVEIILQERSLIHAVESVARENMREERGPRNASRHPGNLANSGGYPDGHRIRESSFGQNDLGHSSLPLRREFSNGSNTRSAGRPSGASFRYPTRSSGAPTNSPRAPRQVGSLGAHENRGPDGNYINHQSCIPYQNSWSQDRPRPNRSPHHARIRGRAENPPVQNIGFSQTYTIGRSSDPTFIGLAAPVRRSSTEENQWHDPRHYQTKVNKNGSQKRQERLAREKPPQY